MSSASNRELILPLLPADRVVMQERRAEVRMLSSDMVTVGWKDKKGQIQSVTGLLEDISPSGACFQLETPVPPGAEMEWRTPKQKFTGHVRYCVYREIGYFVGLEFDPQSRWSKRVYRPQHLLDLSRLLGKRRPPHSP